MCYLSGFTEREALTRFNCLTFFSLRSSQTARTKDRSCLEVEQAEKRQATTQLITHGTDATLMHFSVT